KKYAIKILKKAHMVSCNPGRTPVDTESKLGVDGDPFSRFVFKSMIFESLNSMLLRGLYGYCVFLGNNLLSWSAKHQLMLSRSSAEAEYHGVVNAVAETCWLRNLLRELHSPLSYATLVYYDNVTAVYLSSNPVQHQRTKHIEIDIYFVRDLVVAGQI
nr:ribonuclease H-like domain-containing protein [Tanacetum cinerariifolium]